jgi:predicted flap endonuclease-1-like 5' DNA nuclease
MVALYVQVIVLLAIAYLAGALLASIIRRSLHKPAVPLTAGERRVDPLPEFVRRQVEPAPAPAPAPAARAPSIVTPPPVAEPPQDLKRIRLIDVATESALSRHGVFRYAQIAGWTAADVARISNYLGIGDRISEENWIEQAQILAKGGETAYARRRARGEIATAIAGSDGMGISPSVASALLRPQPSTGGASAVVAEIIQPPMPRARVSQEAVTQAAPSQAPAPVAAVPAAPPSSPDVASRAAFAVERGRVAVPIRPAANPEQENLQRIGNIDAGLAAALNAAGIHRYIQIATWSPQDVEHFEKVLGTGGRIAKENWIEQAQILSRGGDTAFSRQHDRANGIAPQPPVAAPVLAREPAPQAAVMAQPSEPEPARRLRGDPDDLKRIRGIGVLIEKKLNSMGITGYDAIANWTAGDIDRVSQSLDFKGRIERENWVEQARILASGGATEFSRRVDRGEVETSRART